MESQATSKNCFLRIWSKDFGPEKVMEKTAYFVYGGFFITNLWGERFVQSSKGEFLEVPCSLKCCAPKAPSDEGVGAVGD